MSIFSFSPLIKVGVEHRYFAFWVAPGKLYVIYPIFVISVVLFSIITLIKYGWFVTKDKKFRTEVRILLYGYLVASVSGVTNFFPQLFNIYPFGNVFIVFYFLFMGYAIIKFELLNVKIISTQLISSAFVIVIFFSFLRSQTLDDWIVGFVLLLFSFAFGVLLVNSVSKEVRQREKIEALAKQLEDSNSSLAHANDRLKELDQMKTEFISLATHQIRSPLTAIKGYVSMIQEGDYGDVSPQVSNALDVVKQSTDNLVTIVGDFLDVSRIEQGRMKYEISDFDLNQLVKEIVTEYKPNIEKKGLKTSYVFDKNDSYPVHGDRNKIKQVIGNIIDNSIKYTPKGKIDISLIERDDKFLVKIADTGVGIPPKTMPKLFQKFTRAENANEANILGTGLGLYVAKQMIEAHKGRIWAESEGEGKGSQFYIELPKKA